MTIDSTFEEIEQVSSEKGYQLDESSSRDNMKKYVNGKLHVCVGFNYKISSSNDNTPAEWFEFEMCQWFMMINKGTDQLENNEK